jgi:multidrug efflux pump subunit AcrA (membrane-fusion protein)
VWVDAVVFLTPGERTPMTTAVALPPRRSDLVLAPQGNGGVVVKDPRTGAYFQLGPQESFLLQALDGRETADGLCEAFHRRFGEPLTEAEVQEFVEMARSQGLVADPGEVAAPAAPPPAPAAGPPAAPDDPGSGQSLLYWRKSLFDPDRLFGWLEPPLRFVWTPGFVALSSAAIAAAGVVAWTHRTELTATFAGAARWETLLLVWLAVAAVTTCHEFAHGLTCKHYGGEVHEVGFLLLFLMPCFYCNVSDAWLLPSKWRRMAITLAGAYCDLCLWAAAVFVWRLTPPDLLANYLAWVVMSVCGVRTLFNLNPLIKLDGYYLLSDGAEIPNLQARAQAHLKGYLRWALWGAPRPDPEPRGRFLLAYGLASWLFPVGMLVALFWFLGEYLASVAGPAGGAVALAGAVLLLSGHFGGVLGGEARKMVRGRPVRTGAWVLGLCGAAVALGWWEWEDRVHGPVHLRPSVRAELRAEVAGFLREARADEGDSVAAGQVVLRLEVPQLDTKLAQKRAERREAEARLKLLEVGTRPEEVVAQRLRVERARGWRDLAESDLGQARQALTADLTRLDKQIAVYRAELEFARDTLTRVEGLHGRRAVSKGELAEAEKRKKVAEAQAEQAEAARRARVAAGTLAAEAELARRETDLAEARATLGLMESGSRPEEVAAEKARLDRLREEIAHLERLEQKQLAHSAVSGVVTTPRVREGVGKYFREGELICVVEDPGGLEAEIALAEREVARVRVGQPVEIKIQALPLETFTGTVDRIAPRAVEAKDPATQDQSRLTVTCRLDRTTATLRPGMTGSGRISCGPRPLGEIVGERALRYLRPEFWWW